MRASNRAQTLVLCGEAGAGKSHAARMLCAALASAADAPPELGAALEATQGKILSQSPTDATRFWWHLYGS